MSLASVQSSTLSGMGERVVSLEVRPDGVARILYDVPGEPVNTLRASFSKEFEALLEQIEKDPRVVAAILVSGKPDTWIAGADIDMLKVAKTVAQAEALSRAGHATVAKLASSSKPIVAAIHGAALGGGFEVALACRARVLSNDKKTVLAFPEVQLGILPGMNGLQRLAQKAGLQVALDFGLTGKNMRAQKARQLGIADDVVPRPILEDVAAELAKKLAHDGKVNGKGGFHLTGADVSKIALEANPIGRTVLFKKAREETLKKTHGHYPAPERIIEVLKSFASHGFEASKDVEARAFGELVMTPEARHLMELFFAITSLKKDTGTDEKDVKPKSVEKIFVLGAGLMGSGIAYVSLGPNYHVRMKDRDDAALGRGLKGVQEILDDRVKKKQMTRIERDQKLALLTTTTDDSGIKTADLVIEAVFEDLGVKHQVLRRVEELGRPGVIFASNTSAIPIAKIASVSKRPENVVGMHYFSPVHKMPLLEVIRTKTTDPAVVATAVAVGKKQGKTVIVVNDGVGFYTTRVIGPYCNEASWLLMEGLSVEAIDRALVDWGWPVGPLTLLDEVGIDVAAHVGSTMKEAFGERIDPPPVIGKVVTGDRKGRKNERGFYLYGAAAEKLGKGKHVDQSIYQDLGVETPSAKSSKLSAEEIQMRCSLQFVNEALHCFGDGVLRSARDGDVGAVMGLGFPPFRGGPFRFADELGLAEMLRRVREYEQKHGKRWTPAPVLVEMAASGKRFFG
jgi:3-hydroxyacyl-CoA dehydrogenase / enoyl-CoA hydratase / 3-hydroxybutyryl-CoA epimerase